MTGATDAQEILSVSLSTHARPQVLLNLLTKHHAECGSTQDASSLGAHPISIAGTLRFPNELRTRTSRSVGSTEFRQIILAPFTFGENG
jgi:hypothetical protein